MNFYVANGVVVVPVTGRRADATTLDLDRRASTPTARSSAVAGCGARLRWRRRALHHPAGPRATMILRTAFDVPDSPARVDAPRRAPVRVGLVQQRWHAGPGRARSGAARGCAHRRGRRCAARVPARADARRRTSRSRPTGPARAGVEPEALPGGRTHEFAAGSPPSPASRCTRRCTSAPTTAASATTPRSASRPTARCSRARARRTCPSPRATTRTSTSDLGDTGYPVVGGRRRDVRLPDVLGRVVPRGRAPVRAPGRRGDRLPHCDRFRARPSRTSTPSRCGSR